MQRTEWREGAEQVKTRFSRLGFTGKEKLVKELTGGILYLFFKEKRLQHLYRRKGKSQ